MRVLWGIFLVSAGLNVVLLVAGPTSPSASATQSNESRTARQAPARISLSERARLERDLTEARKKLPNRIPEDELITKDWVGIRAMFADLADAFWQKEVRLTGSIAKRYKLSANERRTLNEEGRKLFRSTVQDAERNNAKYTTGKNGERVAILQAEPKALAEFLTQYATFAVQLLGEKRGHLFAQHVLAGQSKWPVERSHRREVRVSQVGDRIAIVVRNYDANGKMTGASTERFQPEEKTSDNNTAWRFGHLLNLDHERRRLGEQDDDR